MRIDSCELERNPVTILNKGRGTTHYINTMLAKGGTWWICSFCSSY